LRHLTLVMFTLLFAFGNALAQSDFVLPPLPQLPSSPGQPDDIVNRIIANPPVPEMPAASRKPAKQSGNDIVVPPRNNIQQVAQPAPTQPVPPVPGPDRTTQSSSFSGKLPEQALGQAT